MRGTGLQPEEGATLRYASSPRPYGPDGAHAPSCRSPRLRRDLSTDRPHGRWISAIHSLVSCRNGCAAAPASREKGPGETHHESRTALPSPSRAIWRRTTEKSSASPTAKTNGGGWGHGGEAEHFPEWGKRRRSPKAVVPMSPAESNHDGCGHRERLCRFFEQRSSCAILFAGERAAHHDPPRAKNPKTTPNRRCRPARTGLGCAPNATLRRN